MIFRLDIPGDISGSWYSGKVHVGLKDVTLEPSSPVRHKAVLLPIAEVEAMTKPVTFFYSDGGPNHCLTHIRVQLSLISLFLKLHLDFLRTAQTTPFHSQCNLVERIMSRGDLGLQCVGLAREEIGIQCYFT